MPECHDCRCHFNPPCSACERCVHIDQTVCPEDCQTCEYDHERTGPYRLIDGTWSDKVNREKRINERYITSRWEITISSDGSAFVWQKGHHLHGVNLPTHAEAIAYADRMAGTQKSSDS